MKRRRNLKRFKKNILLLTLSLLAIGCISVLQASNKSAQNPNNSNNTDNIIIKDPVIGDDTIINDDNILDSDTIIKDKPELDTTNPDSYTVLVNKQYNLPDDYEPTDLVIPNVLFPFKEYNQKKNLREVPAHALEELFEQAENEGIILYAVSGYRSYQRQKSIYNSNINNHGQEYTDKYSAKPGHSEHQTGLAMDVSCPSVGFDLVESFGETKEGIWLKDNAHRFGFILRYPKGSESIVGYCYEPWHVRYVGKDISLEIYEEQITYEEYVNK